MEQALEANYEVPTADRSVTALDDIEGLMQTYRSRVIRFVAFSINDADAVASITQDCFLKAYRSRAQFRGDCAVSTWLIRIAYRLICDYTRTERFKFWRGVQATAVDASELASSLPNAESSPERQAIARQQVAAVYQALTGLPARQRSIFSLYYMDEMSVEDIASSLSLQAATVKTHLYRATAKMRKILGERA